MRIFNTFSQPYLDADTGADLGGGGAPAEPAAEPQDSYNSDIVADSAPKEPAKAEPVEPVKAESEPVKAEPAKAEPAVDAPKLKIKYNHEEKEITLDEARELSQKGLNYDKAVEKARLDARDAYVAEQNWVDFQGNPITTEAEYKQALYVKDLIDKGHSPEEIKKLVDESPEVKQAKEIIAKDSDKEAKEASQKDKMDFLEWFKKENGRFFDNSKDIVPEEVWDANAKGVPLINAYAKYENQTLKDKIKAMQQKTEVAKKAPVGSATAHGSAEVAEEDPFLQGFNSVK